MLERGHDEVVSTISNKEVSGAPINIDPAFGFALNAKLPIIVPFKYTLKSSFDQEPGVQISITITLYGHMLGGKVVVVVVVPTGVVKVVEVVLEGTGAGVVQVEAGILKIQIRTGTHINADDSGGTGGGGRGGGSGGGLNRGCGGGGGKGGRSGGGLSSGGGCGDYFRASVCVLDYKGGHHLSSPQSMRA